jgi:hypothetical protein
MNGRDWWQNFFVEPWAKIQSAGYPPERTSAECDLIQSALELPAGREFSTSHAGSEDIRSSSLAAVFD